MITSEFIVNFYDCDPAGIIFYANIFKYAHSNYEKMIESFKLAHDYFVNDSYVVPIIHSEADYLKPIKTGEKIKVQTTVTILKDASFELTHRFFDDQNELKAKAVTIHVFVDKSTFEKKSIDEIIYKSLGYHLSS